MGADDSADGADRLLQRRIAAPRCPPPASACVRALGGSVALCSSTRWSSSPAISPASAMPMALQGPSASPLDVRCAWCGMMKLQQHEVVATLLPVDLVPSACMASSSSAAAMPSCPSAGRCSAFTDGGAFFPKLRDRTRGPPSLAASPASAPARCRLVGAVDAGAFSLVGVVPSVARRSRRSGSSFNKSCADLHGVRHRGARSARTLRRPHARRGIKGAPKLVGARCVATLAGLHAEPLAVAYGLSMGAPRDLRAA